MMEQGLGHFPPIPSLLAEYEHADTEWFQGFVNVLDATQTALLAQGPPLLARRCHSRRQRCLGSDHAWRNRA